MTTPYEELLNSNEGRIALAEEHAIAHVAELMTDLLRESKMTRAELASKLEVTPGRITQYFDGDSNMTLATVARVLNVFGYFFEGAARRIDDFSAEKAWYPIDVEISSSVNRAERSPTGAPVPVRSARIRPTVGLLIDA